MLLHTNHQTLLHFENHCAHIRITKHLLQWSSKQVFVLLFYYYKPLATCYCYVSFLDIVC